MRKARSNATSKKASMSKRAKKRTNQNNRRKKNKFGSVTKTTTCKTFTTEQEVVYKEVEDIPVGKFRAQAKNWLITTSRTSLKPQPPVKRMSNEKPAWKILTVSEKHDVAEERQGINVETHLHTVLVAPTKIDIRNPKAFNKYYESDEPADNNQCNLRTIKHGKSHLARAVKYILKGPEEIAMSENTDETFWRETGIQDKGKILQAVETIEMWAKHGVQKALQKVRNHPELKIVYFLQRKKLQSFATEVFLRETAREKLTWFPYDVLLQENEETRKICKFINTACNLLASGKRDMPIKGLLLTGDPGLGKTYFIMNNLEKYFTVYLADTASSYLDGYDPSTTQICLFDEMGPKCQLTVQTVNRLYETKGRFRVKFGSIEKNEAVYIVMCSNFESFDKIFPNATPTELRALERRFEHVHITRPLRPVRDHAKEVRSAQATPAQPVKQGEPSPSERKILEISRLIKQQQSSLEAMSTLGVPSDYKESIVTRITKLKTDLECVKEILVSEKRASIVKFPALKSPEAVSDSDAMMQTPLHTGIADVDDLTISIDKLKMRADCTKELEPVELQMGPFSHAVDYVKLENSWGGLIPLIVKGQELPYEKHFEITLYCDKVHTNCESYEFRLYGGAEKFVRGQTPFRSCKIFKQGFEKCFQVGVVAGEYEVLVTVYGDHIEQNLVMDFKWSDIPTNENSHALDTVMFEELMKENYFMLPCEASRLTWTVDNSKNFILCYRLTGLMEEKLEKLSGSNSSEREKELLNVVDTLNWQPQNLLNDIRDECLISMGFVYVFFELAKKELVKYDVDIETITVELAKKILSERTT